MIMKSFEEISGPVVMIYWSKLCPQPDPCCRRRVIARDVRRGGANQIAGSALSLTEKAVAIKKRRKKASVT